MKKRSLVLVALLIQLSLAIPSPRYKGGCVLVNKNKVYCAGGQSGPTSPTYQSDLYGLDLSHDYTDLNSLNNAWTTLAPLTESNSEFVMVPSGTNGFFINGGTGSANGKPLQYQSLVYNGATNTWTNLVAANATNSLAQAKGAVGTIDSLDLNDVYIWGGVLDASIGSVNTTYSGTFLVMNPTTGTWNPSLVKGTTSLGWTPRIGHAMLNSFSTISVFGGQEAKYDTISRTYSLSPASMSSIPQFDTILLAWRLANVTGDIPTPRSYHTVNSAGVFQALLYGGATPGTNTPVTDPSYQARLSGNSVEWTRLSVTGGPGPRFGHSAVTFGYNTVLVIGGVDTTGAAKSDVNVYSFSQKQWRTSFATSEFYSYTSNSPNGNSSSNIPPSGSSSSSYSGGSSPFALQQGIAGGIGAGGFVFLGLIGLGLYLAIEKKNKQVLVDHPLDPLTHGDGYTKIEVSPSIDDRPLPPAPAMQTASHHERPALYRTTLNDERTIRNDDDDDDNDDDEVNDDSTTALNRPLRLFLNFQK